MIFRRIIVLFLFLPLVTGCARMIVNSFMRPAMANLQKQTDIQLVCEGTPSFLLLLDSMVAADPEDKELLLTATKAFTGYAAALDACNKPKRAATISEKARLYGLSLLWNCDNLKGVCTLPFVELEGVLAKLDEGDVERLFWAGNAWTTWIRHQNGSPESLAQLVRVERIMQRVLELDETVYHGGAHIFLGAYLGSKPKLLGGKPELSKHHFEQALAISNRQFLPALVLYAQTYARTSFNRELYEDLLKEVLSFDLENEQDAVLANRVAAENAARMLDEVEQYF